MSFSKKSEPIIDTTNLKDGDTFVFKMLPNMAKYLAILQDERTKWEEINDDESDLEYP